MRYRLGVLGFRWCYESSYRVYVCTDCFAPLLAILYLIPFPGNHWLCSGLFILASLTDWLDGFIARRYRLETRLGTFLDPVADKILVSVALVLLVGQHRIHWITLPAAIIISREIVVSALREWMAEIGQRSSVAVSVLGKIKTTLQMVSITLLLAYKPASSPLSFVVLGVLFLYCAAGLTVWSMFLYLRSAWPSFESDLQGEKPVAETQKLD